jgi:hypothetical protein
VLWDLMASDTTATYGHNQHDQQSDRHQED